MQLILLGDGAVGKTSLLKMYSEKEFTDSHMATIGLDCVSCSFKAPSGVSVPVKIWDTAGQERFKSITETFYRQANGIIILFDVTNQQTMLNVKNWLQAINQHADVGVVKVLVGNKIDLDEERQIDIKTGE